MGLMEALSHTTSMLAFVIVPARKFVGEDGNVLRVVTLTVFDGGEHNTAVHAATLNC